MKKAWITGVCGLIGSHLAEALMKEGWKVGGNDNLSGGDIENLPKGVYFQELDCCQPTFSNALNSFVDFEYCWSKGQFGVPDVVIHTACLAHEGLSTFSPYLVTHSVFDASVKVFSESIRHGVKRIVYLSSMSRYGDQTPPFTEDMPTKPVDCYGIAKVAAEDVLKNLGKSHGVAWSIITPHNCIGTKQRVEPYRNVCSIMLNRCLQGKPALVYGDGSQKRCFSSIKDCLPSIIRAVNGDADSEVVNIGPDNGEITIWELATRIMRMVGISGTPVMVPPRKNEVHQAYCSSDKARRLLGYKEVQSLDDCLKDMFEYMRERGPKKFDYHLPIEILTPETPRTWVDRLI